MPGVAVAQSNLKRNEPATTRQMQELSTLKTPWSRSALFYWAFMWRTLALYLGFAVPFIFIYPIVRFFLNDWPLLERVVRVDTGNLRPIFDQSMSKDRSQA
jgi:hypothetical protein